MSLILTLELRSGETHRYAARALSGYHRPLNGETANLTVLLDRAPETDPDWFLPPLGAQATVNWDDETLLIGVLTGASLDRTTVTLRIEG